MSAGNERLQNDFLNSLRKNRTPVSIFLTTGERFEGRITSFDIYSIQLDGPEPRLIVKTVIATVLPASKAKRPKKTPAAKFPTQVLRPRLTAESRDGPRKAPEIQRKKRRVPLTKV